MYEMNGLEVAKIIMGYTAIVFCSAYVEDVIRSYEPGAVDYLRKPIVYGRFVLGVEKVKADR